LTGTEVNSNPTVQPITDRNVDEGSLLSIMVSASDVDIPAQTLSYSLQNAPAGMTVSSSGVISWTPTEAQGAGNYNVSVTVSDGALGTATTSFNVNVTEVNTAPVIGAITDQTVSVGALVGVTVTATDADLPAQTLTCTLEPGAPSGAAITGGGSFTWTPSAAQAGTTNLITVRVRDSHSPQGTSTRSFTVIVRPLSTAPQLGASLSAQKQCVITWNTQAGVRYRIHYKDVLPGGTWQQLADVDGTGNVVSHTDVGAGITTRFYQVEVLP
jgi:hypothetical protein